jgi:hypothetical protein
VPVGGGTWSGGGNCNPGAGAAALGGAGGGVCAVGFTPEPQAARIASDSAMIVLRIRDE